MPSTAPAMLSLHYCEHVEGKLLCLFLKQEHAEIIMWSRTFLSICLFKFSKGLSPGLRNALGFRLKQFGLGLGWVSLAWGVWWDSVSCSISMSSKYLVNTKSTFQQAGKPRGKRSSDCLLRRHPGRHSLCGLTSPLGTISLYCPAGSPASVAGAFLGLELWRFCGPP